MIKHLSLIVATLLASTAIAKPVDRAQWYDGNQTTTDDPRRIPVPKGYREPKGAILIKNARLFDGTGAAARPAAILIEGSHITRIAASDAGMALPEGTVTIEAGGRTVMPGLIDLHSHITYNEATPMPDAIGDRSQAGAALRGQERLRYFLESGITSVRDVASHGLSIFLLKDYIADNRLPGPRIFAAGQLITGTGGHGADGFAATAPGYPDGSVYEASGVDGFRNAVRQQFENGADLIKLASHFSPEEVKAAVDEAHNLGLKVTCDCETIYTAMAVEAGVDGIEHPLPRSDETIKAMAAKGIWSDITLVPYQLINANGGGYFGSSSRRFSETDKANFAMARKLKAAGVTLGVGTDLVADWFKYLPDAYIQELRNFGTLGYSASQALVTATKTNSEILGMGDRLGTIAVGKLADIIIVDGKPDENVEDLKKLDTVLVNGRVMVRGGALSIPRHEQGKPPYLVPAQ